MSTRARTRRTACTVALALLASLGTVLAAPAAAAAPGPAYRAGVAPATVEAGERVRVEVTITHVAPQGNVVPLSEADVTVPAGLLPVGGLTADRVQLVAAPEGWTATIDPAAETVELRHGGPKLVKAGASLVVAITVHARSQVEPHLFATRAAGPGGSSVAPFRLDGPEPSLLVLPVVTSLEFGTPPTAARTGEILAPPVTVLARDAAGGPVAGVQVVLEYGPGSSRTEPLPAGRIATTGGDGVATFAALRILEPGIGYTLVAASGPVRSAESAPFDIGDSVTVCAAATPCDSGTVTSDDGGTRFRVAAEPGAPSVLVVFFDDRAIECAQPSAVAVFNVPGRATTITGTRLRGETVGTTTGTDGPYRTQVCFESTVPFPTSDGTPADDGDGNGFPEGLLPDCAPGATAAGVEFPCVASRAPLHSGGAGNGRGYGDGDGGVVVTVLAPAGDPRMTW